MNVDGEPVTIAVAGVAVGDSDLDEPMMHRIASPGCYMRVEEVSRLREFLAVIGSSTGNIHEKVDEVRRLTD